MFFSYEASAGLINALVVQNFFLNTKPVYVEAKIRFFGILSLKTPFRAGSLEPARSKLFQLSHFCLQLEKA